MSRKRKIRGFTLVELLVVVAIVALLASLLLPSLSRAKQRALSIQCGNNLRQWSVALQLYLGDHQCYPGPFVMRYLADYIGEKYPVQKGYGSAAAIQKSVKSVYHCPAYDLLPGWYDSLPAGFVPYGYNIDGVGLVTFDTTAVRFSGLGLAGRAGTFPNDASALRTRESAVITPANMIAIADARLYSLRPIIFDTGPSPPAQIIGSFFLNPLSIPPKRQAQEIGLNEGIYQRRHNAEFNTLFCDGHLESLRIKKLFTSRSDVLSRWNNDGLPHRELASGEW